MSHSRYAHVAHVKNWSCVNKLGKSEKFWSLREILKDASRMTHLITTEEVRKKPRRENLNQRRA